MEFIVCQLYLKKICKTNRQTDKKIIGPYQTYPVITDCTWRGGVQESAF